MTHNLPRCSYFLLPIQIPYPPNHLIDKIVERDAVRASAKYPSAVVPSEVPEPAARAKHTKIT
jgi:hypothetical protein